MFRLGSFSKLSWKRKQIMLFLLSEFLRASLLQENYDWIYYTGKHNKRKSMEICWNRRTCSIAWSGYNKDYHFQLILITLLLRQHGRGVGGGCKLDFRFSLYCTARQHPLKKASTQRHGQPAFTDIWENQLILVYLQ